MSRAFLRVAAACWIVSSATTLCLIFLPRLVPQAPDLESQAALLYQPAYMARVWLAIFHPLLVLVGALGVLAVRFRRSPGALWCGFLFFLLWAFTEGVQQSLVLVALNWTWRAGYLASADTAVRSELALHIRGFDALSDGLFFFLLIAFILANLCYSVGLWERSRLSRAVSVFFALAAGLGLVSLLTSFGGGALPASVMAVLYPTIQPAGRFLTGVWLWRSLPENPE